MSDREWSGHSPFVAQGRLVDELAREVAVDGAAAVFEPVILSTIASFARYAQQPDGGRKRIRCSSRAQDLAVELREVMYRPEVGTWFLLEMTVSPAGAVSTRFHYDDEPVWTVDPGAVAYLKDLERFPREVAHQPAWLRAKLAEGRGLMSGNFGPQVWFGVRVEASFTADGSYSGVQPQGPAGPAVWGWADRVGELVTAGGVQVKVGEEQDPHQDDVTYPLVSLPIGEGGRCGVLFLPTAVSWSVDVRPDQASREDAQRVLDLVRVTVQRVTGWRLVAEQVADGYTHVMVGLGPLDG